MRVSPGFIVQLIFPVVIAAGFWFAAFPLGRGDKGGARHTVNLMLRISPEREMLNARIKDFEKKNPGVEVRVLWVPANQYQVKLKTLLAAGLAPDVFITGDVWLAYMLPFLMDLTPYLERDRDEVRLEDFYPGVLDAMFEGGRCHFLPAAMNLSLLYYNRGLFEQMGMQTPTPEWTWADYVEAGRRLTFIDPATDRNVWGSTIITGWWGEWLIFVRQAGGSLFNDDGTRCLLDSPESVQGLQFYADKVLREKISPPPGRGPSSGFVSGAFGMSFGEHAASWNVFNQVADLDWDIQILPEGPAGRTGGEVAFSAYGIAKTTRNAEAAWEVVKFLGSTETMIAVSGGGLPVRRSVAGQRLHGDGRAQNPAHPDVVYEQLPYAKPIPRLPDFIEITMQIIQPEIDLMLEGRQTAEQAAQRATASANAFLKTIAVKQTGGKQ